MNTPTTLASGPTPRRLSRWRAPQLTLRFWPVFLRNLLVWRKLAIPSLLGNIAEPLMWLVAFGYGMGAQRAVRERQCAHTVHLHHIRLQVLGNQIAGCAFGYFFAVVQHQEARAQALSLVHKVGGQQNRFALLQQQLQALPHQVAGLWVQAGGGFVQQQQLGVIHQSARQAQAPLHATRELARLGFGLAGEGGKFE